MTKLAVEADAVPTCTVAARRRGDLLAGTAMASTRFLLVEDPGPWGQPPHPVGALPPGVVEHVHEQARTCGARLLLIRRTGRRSTDEPARTWAYVDLVEDCVRSGRVASADALADVDFCVDGTAATEPWYLVCTQGRHDVCCALYGRPVVQALDAVAPGRTWECSHVGGDRFAANLLLLPSGLMYGHLHPAAALDVVTALERGSVVPAYLRGRCGIASAAQVAEQHARGFFDELSTGALEPVVARHGAGGHWCVEVTHRSSGARLRVDLVEQHREVRGGLTCDSPGPGRLRNWELLALTPLS